MRLVPKSSENPAKQLIDSTKIATFAPSIEIT